ncbi:hypothetical protein ACVWXM_001360 [Bradyrhizobium sp. GM7.3]
MTFAAAWMLSLAALTVLVTRSAAVPVTPDPETMEATVVPVLRSIVPSPVPVLAAVMAPAMASKTSADDAPTAEICATVLWTWTPAESTAVAVGSPPMAVGTGSNVVSSTPSRWNAAATCRVASAADTPPTASEVMRVVSGVTTVEPSGAFSVPEKASPVETSVPPVMIRVPTGLCSVKLPSALVIAEASPSSNTPLPFLSANTKAPAM